MSELYAQTGKGDSRFGDWLPPPQEVCKWLDELINQAKSNPTEFDPVIKDFQSLVEDDPALEILAKKMFEEIPRVEGDATYNVKDFEQALAVINEILTTPPYVRSTGAGLSAITVPFNAVLNWPANTTSGYVFFLNRNVNNKIKNIVNKWGDFIKCDPRSTKYINHDAQCEKNWFSDKYQKIMKEYAQWQDKPIEKLYKCDPRSPTWGFDNWDAFFTREFCEDVRKVSEEDKDDKVVVNACESGMQNLAHRVKDRDTFWLKTQPYSIIDMMDSDSYSYRFFNGTVYQGWLSSACYHRWHAPVSGTVRKTVHIPGTYYSNVRSHLYPNPDPSGPNLSQCYLASVATRALIFIEADNKHIGLVCFLAIGMNEISSCEIIVNRNQHVDKGQPLGMFHMGGSGCCLIFEPRVRLNFVSPSKTDNPHNMFKLNSRLATVEY
ncbi:putative phosphatidylserine decarboxylase [Aspergillus californicus]